MGGVGIGGPGSHAGAALGHQGVRSFAIGRTDAVLCHTGRNAGEHTTFCSWVGLGWGRRRWPGYSPRRQELPCDRWLRPRWDVRETLAAVLVSLRLGDLLFLHEIHRLPSACAEALYAAMEDFRLDILAGDGASAFTEVTPPEKQRFSF